MSCQDTIIIRRGDGTEEEIPLDDLWDPFVPPDVGDNTTNPGGGDPAAIETIEAYTFASTTPADGATGAAVTVIVRDSAGLGVEGLTVTADPDAEITIGGSAVTNQFGEAEFTATSATIGTFNVVFSETTAGSDSLALEFVDPDLYSPPDDGPYGEDCTPEEAVTAALALMVEIRSEAESIDPSIYPILDYYRLNKFIERVDEMDYELSLFGSTESIIQASFDGQRALQAAVRLSRAVFRFLNDNAYDKSFLDTKTRDLVSELECAFGGPTNSGAGPIQDQIDDSLGSDLDPSTWTEQSRETSTVNIEGVEIARIDAITFSIPGGKSVRLVLDNPDPEAT